MGTIHNGIANLAIADVNHDGNLDAVAIDIAGSFSVAKRSTTTLYGC